jgi:hypothetical protein
MMIAVAVVGETGRIFGWINMLVVRHGRYWLRWMMHPQSFQHPSRSTLTTYISTLAPYGNKGIDGKVSSFAMFHDGDLRRKATFTT